MAKFRKKPVIVDAFLWDGTNEEEIFDAFHDTNRAISAQDDKLLIATLEGEMTANPGDWIIRGVAGEVYPCKPYVFVETYEPVDDEPDWIPTNEFRYAVTRVFRGRDETEQYEARKHRELPHLRRSCQVQEEGTCAAQKSVRRQRGEEVEGADQTSCQRYVRPRELRCG